jgi:hypothetical protein
VTWRVDNVQVSAKTVPSAIDPFPTMLATIA